MEKFEVKVGNRAGLHTRPAAVLVKLTSKFKSDIQIERNGFKINGKSIIGVMTLAAEQGSTLIFYIDGEDEKDAKNEIKDLFESNFDEPV